MNLLTNPAVPSSQSAITRVPPDIITAIAAQIDSGADRAAFALTCSAFYRGFLSTTWKDVELEFSPRNVPDYPLDAWTGPWTARIGHVKVDKWSSCVNTDLLYDGVTDGTYSDFGRHLCSEPLCRRSTLLRMLGPFFVLCSPGKIPERPRSLTVRGRFAEFSESIWPPQIGCHAPGINQVMKVKAFIFEKYWEFFDISMLNMVSWKYLCILKVPVKYPTDCVFLGKMIKRMPALKSLTIVDLPDNHLYFKSYKYLGRGIIARAASLQELDISFTNFNRPNPYKASKEWCGIWIEPQPPTLHFQKIFRQSKKTTEERKRLMFIDRRNNIHSSIESVDHSPGPLRLKKLRLRNMTIPDYASNEVFNWSCLNELELLNSKVDDQIWRDLQCTQLTSLRAIDYSILPGAFMKFLATQKSLETITFTRPADIYKERGWAPWNGEPMLRIKLAHEAPAQGPGTTAGMRALVKANRRKGNHAAIPQYPTFSELMECLQRDRLKELSIPVDMYDVTPEIVGRIGDLPNLEQLTWGFDYSDQELQRAFVEGFLMHIPKLRRMTLFAEVGPYNLPSHDPTFGLQYFQKYLQGYGGLVPPTLRYLRFLRPGSRPGYHHEAGTYYHVQEPVDGAAGWIKIPQEEAVKMYMEERTPRVV